MQRAMRASFAASLFFLGSCRLSRSQTNPVSKAIELLHSLEEKIEAEGAASKNTHEEKQAACKDASKDLEFSITTSKAAIEDAKATVAKETVTIETLKQDILNKQAAVAGNEAQLTSATKMRENESALFQSQEEELLDIIDTLKRAIGILEMEMKKNGSFVQGLAAKPVVQALASLVQGPVLSTADASRLSALMQRGEDRDDRGLGAPDAAVYTSQSGDIVDTLEGLLEEAQGQLDAAQKAEMTSTHNFNMEQQALEIETKNTKAGLATAAEDLAESTDEKKAATAKLAAESKSLSDDQAALETLTKACAQGREDFEAETESRAEELEAIAKALTALGEVGNATALTYGGGASLLQRSQVSSASALKGSEIPRLLRDLATKERAPELAQLASRVALVLQQGAQDGADPFVKVRGLISDLITKLEEEASAEASTKEKCDEDIADSTAESEEKTLGVQKLTAKIDRWSSESAVLEEEIEDLKEKLAKLAATQSKMDKVREDENAEYKQRKSDLTDGLEGVALAIRALSEYYAEARTSHEASEASASGIIAILEVVRVDFARDLAAAEETEVSAKSEYEATSKSNEIEKVTMEKDVAYKTKEKKTLDKYAKDATVDRSSLQEQLDAVNKYLDERKKQCADKALTYEERKQRRKNEIEGLQEALSILESETALVQQRTRRSTRSLRLRPVGKLARKGTHRIASSAP